MNGKQVRIKRPPTVDGMDIEDYVRLSSRKEAGQPSALCYQSNSK